MYLLVYLFILVVLDLCRGAEALSSLRATLCCRAWASHCRESLVGEHGLEVFRLSNLRATLCSRAWASHCGGFSFAEHGLEVLGLQSVVAAWA